MSNEELMAMAKDAVSRAYAPYSNFKVGAALLATDGRVFIGCNVENASYGGTICAERTAVVKGVSEGATEFVKIAVATNPETFAAPCGICRQVLYEFMPEGEVLMEHPKDGIQAFKLTDLMPYAFGPKDLQ